MYLVHSRKKELRQKLEASDMLHIYANAIKEFNMDIRAVFRQTLPEKYSKTDYV